MSLILKRSDRKTDKKAQLDKNVLSQKKSLYSLYFHSLGSDVSDHIFWSEYRVNRTRFHSLSSEFLLDWS